MTRPSQALVDLNALRHNYELSQALAPHSQNIAVIKANAYGHGMLPAAKALAQKAPAFAIACTEEALELRAGGISQPLLLLEGFFQVEELKLAEQHNFWLMIENREQVDALIAAKLPRPVTVWLKVDTGMHRLGAPMKDVSSFYQRLLDSPNIAKPVILATHLACADELDKDMTLDQIRYLDALAMPLNAPLSIANSPGLLGWPQARREWNRPGYMLYGDSPFTCAHPEADNLQPVMSFQSRVISLRHIGKGETVGYGATWKAEGSATIATIPVGYGDGYPRNAPSGTPVLIEGQRAALAGRVSMDLITVDVTGLHNVHTGSPVELWGKKLKVSEVAACANTIGYELLTRMPGRLRRGYQG
ncbi:MAG: alanine racemase [Pseudomonadales bacterium]|nr:alanine racemase [Pseudomonadales bacterium]